MSSVWKKPNYGPKQQERNWLNLCWGTHDQFCNCNDPWLHFMIVLNKQSKYPKPESDIKNAKCLITGKEDTEKDSSEEDDGGFHPGELEKLFQEPDDTTDAGPDEER